VREKPGFSCCVGGVLAGISSNGYEEPGRLPGPAAYPGSDAGSPWRHAGRGVAGLRPPDPVVAKARHGPADENQFCWRRRGVFVVSRDDRSESLAEEFASGVGGARLARVGLRSGWRVKPVHSASSTAAEEAQGRIRQLTTGRPASASTPSRRSACRRTSYARRPGRGALAGSAVDPGQPGTSPAALKRVEGRTAAAGPPARAQGTTVPVPGGPAASGQPSRQILSAGQSRRTASTASGSTDTTGCGTAPATAARA
jgi:hypothetical protein